MPLNWREVTENYNKELNRIRRNNEAFGIPKPASPMRSALKKFLPENLKKAIETRSTKGFKPNRELARTPVSAKKYSPRNFGPRKVVQRSPTKELNYVRMAQARVLARKHKQKIPNKRRKIKNQSPFVQIFNGKKRNNTVSSVLEEPILETPLELKLKRIPKTNTPSPIKNNYIELNEPILKTPTPKGKGNYVFANNNEKKKYIRIAVKRQALRNLYKNLIGKFSKNNITKLNIKKKDELIKFLNSKKSRTNENNELLNALRPPKPTTPPKPATPPRPATPPKVKPESKFGFNLTDHGIVRGLEYWIDLAKRRGKKLGRESAYGVVHDVGKPGIYVIKRMNFHDEDDVKSFRNEIKVGSLPRIGEVGPRIYAYKIIMRSNGNDLGYGEYIMDHVTKGQKYKRFLDLNDYFDEKYKTFCPTSLTGDPILQALKETLFKFYTITKGYHGDLHGGNILVLIPTQGEPSVQIIDYGSHKEFANKSNETCVSKYLQKQYAEKYLNVSNKWRTRNNKIRQVFNFPSGGQLHTANASKHLIRLIARENLKTKGSIREMFFDAIKPLREKELKKITMNYGPYVAKLKQQLKTLKTENLKNIQHNANLVVGISRINRNFFKSRINDILTDRRISQLTKKRV